jgi:SEC-C motif-containing protein
MRCPCGTGVPYDACCGPAHTGSAPAPTAEKLMRSRYSAFALGDAEYLLRTWHASTRPASLRLDSSRRWAGLTIDATDGGGLLHKTGTVEFTASYEDGAFHGSQHEKSSFVREDGQWFYVDGR